ncbi:MAG: response regulator [Chloroflexi bacterium]|nr:MAG: response regulator [Chloroflexota bacterium]
MGAPPSAMMKKKKTPLILIVEDDPASLLLASTVLEAAGYEVAGSASAEDARETLAKRKPALILMDIGLPGMDGLDFTRELRSKSRTAGIPIVALTGLNMPLYERSAKAAGCQGFIVKPVSPAVLTTEVRNFLSRGPG